MLVFFWQSIFSCIVGWWDLMDWRKLGNISFWHGTKQLAHCAARLLLLNQVWSFQKGAYKIGYIQHFISTICLDWHYSSSVNWSLISSLSNHSIIKYWISMSFAWKIRKILLCIENLPEKKRKKKYRRSRHWNYLKLTEIMQIPSLNQSQWSKKLIFQLVEAAIVEIAFVGGLPQM